MKIMNIKHSSARIGHCIIAACLAGVAGQALAQSDKRYYVTPMATYVSADSDRPSDDGIGGTLALGVPLGRSAEFELRGTFLSYDGDTGFEDIDIAAGGFGFNFFLLGRRGPYLHGDVMGGDETLFNIGLGYDFALNDNFSIRAEALHHHESNSNVTEEEFKEPLFNLGLRWVFGDKPEPPPPPPPPPAPAPAPPPPPPPVCADGLDNDGDGLSDYPNDPGCTSEDDGDETDPAPPCKTPELGERVSLEGCGTGDIIVLRGVNFDFDQSVLTANARQILDGVADALDARPDIEVELSGHTDGKGSESYNASLSDRRAASVKRYLVSKGIADARMTTIGYGELQPIATNDTDEGRELNRRVELKVTASAGVAKMAEPASSIAKSEPAFEPESAPPPAAPGGTRVSIVDFSYSPENLTVAVGTTVTWTNQDGSTHFVTFDDLSSDGLRKNGTFERQFDTPGVYPYTCSRHPSMTGTVTVQ